MPEPIAETTVLPPTKSVFKSKTVLVNLVIALAALYPPVQEWVQAHPEQTLIGITAINAALRYVTKGRVSLFNS